MRQRRYVFRQNPAISGYVAAAHFQKIVECARNQVAFLYFGNFAGGLIKGAQRGFAGIGKFDFYKCDMRRINLLRVDHRTISGDNLIFFQSPQSCLCRGLRQSDPSGQFGYTHTAIHRQMPQDGMIKTVKLDLVHFTGKPVLGRYKDCNKQKIRLKSMVICVKLSLTSC
jgi:hypothetical protein